MSIHLYNIIVDATVSQVAIAWLLHRPSVASVVIGARTLEQLEENLQSVNLHFSKEEVSAGRGCVLIRGVIASHGIPVMYTKGPTSHMQLGVSHFLYTLHTVCLGPL